MAEEGASLKVTRDLKAAISAILQHYGGGQQPVTDASAELHRLCGCLELLLQFDQKEQKSFLRPQKTYWDFLCTALWQQRGDTELVRFVHSQDKLKTPLGRGRAFIRFCLVQGQLAESLQLCLLNPELTREWYGPRSPLVCPELQEDLLDSLYTLNGVTFNLDLQWPDLDGAWPMFSESSCSNSSLTQGRRPRKAKDSPKQISATSGGPTGVQPEEPHASQAGCLQDAPREDWSAGLPTSQQRNHSPPSLGKREDPRSLRPSQSMWEPEGEESQQDQKGAPRTGVSLENSTLSFQGQGEGTKGALREIEAEAEGRGALPGAEGQRTTAGAGAHEGEAEWGHVHTLLASSPKEMIMDTMSRNRQGWGMPLIPREPQLLRGLGAKEGRTTEKLQEQEGVTSVTRREEQAEVALKDVVKSLRQGLWKTKEQAQHQEQLLKEQEWLLKTLQEQLSRCQEEKARLQAELEQKQQEAERRDAMYEEDLGRQRDLTHAMKRRVLELIHQTMEQMGKMIEKRDLSERRTACGGRSSISLPWLLGAVSAVARSLAGCLGGTRAGSAEAWFAMPALWITRRESAAARSVPKKEKHRSPDKDPSRTGHPTPHARSAPSFQPFPAFWSDQSYLLEAGDLRRILCGQTVVWRAEEARLPVRRRDQAIHLPTTGWATWTKPSAVWAFPVM